MVSLMFIFRNKKIIVLKRLLNNNFNSLMPQTNTKHIKSVISMCPINIYTYNERGIIFLLHRFIFNVNAVGIRLLKLLFNNRFNTIIFLFLKINISDTMIIYVWFLTNVASLILLCAIVLSVLRITKVYQHNSYIFHIWNSCCYSWYTLR
jgi:hypothetical protein